MSPRKALGPLLALLAACGVAKAPADPTTSGETPTRGSTTLPATAKPPPDTLNVPTPTKVTVPPSIAAILAAPDRSEDDKARDAGRKPAEMLAFFGIAPGMRVAELGAGGGYTAELLARAVGPTGKVYGQNTKFILERFAEKPWSERLKKPIMQNVVRVDTEFDAPIPADVKDLDAVLLVLFYHDTVWMKTDREALNRNIFNALKSGGVFGVVDHSAKPGTGVAEAQTLHRIDEVTLREEVQRAGFKLVEQADFLRNPSDPRDWNTAPSAAGEKRGTSDRFVLKFVKP